MKKPPFSLAISAALALTQANLLPALSEPASPSEWQKLAGAKASVPTVKTGSTTVKKLKSAPQVMARASASKNLTVVGGNHGASGIASGAIKGHAMLFLSGKNKDAAASGAPAAALTIHPALPESTEQTAAVSSQEKPTLVAMNGDMPADLSVASAAVPTVVPPVVSPPAAAPIVETAPVVPAVSTVQPQSKQLLAQLAPDQIVAQGDAVTTTASPIPPVVSGTVDLEEFKTSNVIDLKVSQSRTFKLRNKIVRTSISDPSVAEPVVVAENQLVLLGKSPGGATLVIWDDSGASIAIDLRVARDYSALQSMLREIDPRIIVKPFSVGGSDRVLLMGDVDHPESVIRAFSAANAFMDDRGMKIIAANNRLLEPKVGELAAQQTGGGGGQQGGGPLSTLGIVDKFTFFSNTGNNVGKAQSMVSDGGRVTSLIRVRKTPLIVLHVTFMEMNTSSVRELGVQLGINYVSQSFGFGIGGRNTVGEVGSFLTALPGQNGTQGQVAAGTAIPGQFGVTSLAGGSPIFNGATVPPGGGALGAALPFVAGFTQGFPSQAPNYGAISSPAAFASTGTATALINGVATAGTGLSSIGQAAFPVAPVGLLGQSILHGAPGGATFSAANLSNLFTGISNIANRKAQRWSINPSIQGIITHSRARVLAEPTLVTISGERAAFLAGGEIPILQSIATAGAAQQSVVFEPFGLRLNMIPVLLENGNINLQVAPEERTLSQVANLNVPLSTTNIPSFTTRKTQTIVELKPGQELYISGLVTANSGRELNKTPIAGEIPVLGALYRSKAFNKNESELVVSVRPEIILPGTPGQMKLPEEISRVEGPRDTNILQVEPTIVDERYNTSGRSERYQKIPGILPTGSPIPDSQ